MNEPNKRESSPSEMGGQLLARVLRGGFTALIVRVLSVLLSYLMFVFISRNMSSDSFGEFGFAFALATFLAVVAVLGQPMLLLRLLPIYESEGSVARARSLVFSSRIAVLVGSLLCATLILLASGTWIQVSQYSLSYGVWIGVFVLTLAMARHQAYLLRAYGKIVFGMAPRDIVWRLVVIAIVFEMGRSNAQLPAVDVIRICASSLLVVLVIQLMFHRESRPALRVECPSFDDVSQWKSESRGLWLVSMVQASGPNLSVVLLGIVLVPAETGAFFVSVKTATLLQLPLAAGAIVGAPLISRYYHSGNLERVRELSRYLIVGISVPVVLGVVLLAIFGDEILGLFGSDFSSALPVLMILAFGTLINALCGPTGFIMNMTGHHGEYLRIVAITQSISLALLPVAAKFGGTTGAAMTVAAGMISWNIWVRQWCCRELRIDPTVLSLFENIRVRRKRGDLDR